MRPGLAFLVSAAALLAIAAPASAHHVTAAATVSSQLGGVAPKPCDLRAGAPCKRDGSRLLVVNWSVSCGGGGDPEFQVRLMVKPKKAVARPIEYDGISSGDLGLAQQGSWTFVLEHGTRVVSEIVLTCTGMDDASGTLHTAEASAGGSEHYLPPAILGYDFDRWSLCGYAPTRRNQRKLQVGQYATIEPQVAFSPASLLSGSFLKQVRLVLRGGGLRARLKPRARDFRRGRLLFDLPTPRRSGKIKVWALLDGTATNKISIPVLRDRGCA